jgi:hypothetical protein
MERIATLLGLTLGFIGRLLFPTAPTHLFAREVVLIAFASLIVTTLLIGLFSKGLRARVKLPFSIDAAILWPHLNGTETSLVNRAAIGALLLLTFVLLFTAASMVGFVVAHVFIRT